MLALRIHKLEDELDQKGEELLDLDKKVHDAENMLVYLHERRKTLPAFEINTKRGRKVFNPHLLRFNSLHREEKETASNRSNSSR